jgi:hypothetical protein
VCCASGCALSRRARSFVVTRARSRCEYRGCASDPIHPVCFHRQSSRITSARGSGPACLFSTVDQSTTRAGCHPSLCVFNVDPDTHSRRPQCVEVAVFTCATSWFKRSQACACCLRFASGGTVDLSAVCWQVNRWTVGKSTELQAGDLQRLGVSVSWLPMHRYDKGLHAAGYGKAVDGVYGDVSSASQRCGFRGCQEMIRAGELHIVRTGHSRGVQLRTVLHLECGVHRGWLRRQRCTDAWKASGGLWNKADEIRAKAGLPPIAKAS